MQTSLRVGGDSPHFPIWQKRVLAWWKNIWHHSHVHTLKRSCGWVVPSSVCNVVRLYNSISTHTTCTLHCIIMKSLFSLSISWYDVGWTHDQSWRALQSSWNWSWQGDIHKCWFYCTDVRISSLPLYAYMYHIVYSVFMTYLYYYTRFTGGGSVFFSYVQPAILQIAMYYYKKEQFKLLLWCNALIMSNGS